MLANLGFDRLQSQPSGSLHEYCKGENLDYLYTLRLIEEKRKGNRAGARSFAARGKEPLPESCDGGVFRHKKARSRNYELQHDHGSQVLIADRQ